MLDEADRMMDMGFWPDVRRIIAAMHTVRQTLLFSATMPDEVVRLALEIVRRAEVRAGRVSAALPPTTITHRAHVVSGGPEKLDWLIEHLRRPEGPVLIFSRTKIGADRLAHELAAAGIRCIALHADRTMDQRRQAVEGFRGGRYKVLVATDIAARGLDIDGIHTVINYELPDSADTYVHRVGRTGRADETGHALTLVAPEERHAPGPSRKVGRRSFRIGSSCLTRFRRRRRRRPCLRRGARRVAGGARGSSLAAGGGRRKTAPSAAVTATCYPLPARPDSTPKPGARTARSTSSVGRRRNETRTSIGISRWLLVIGR